MNAKDQIKLTKLFSSRYSHLYPLNYQRISVLKKDKPEKVTGYIGISIPNIQNHKAFNMSFYKCITRFEK